MTGMEVSHLAAVGAGLLSFLSPCVLPLVIPYLAFLGGVTLQDSDPETSSGATLRRVLPAALAFVLGFSTIFMALGATASALSGLITRYIHVLAPVAGVIIILLGLHFLGVFRILALFREARFHIDARPAGLLGAYVVGLAFAFGWTPCVGPILAAILMVAGSEGSLTYGASLLGAYALGLGIPFLAAAVAVQPFMAFLKHFRRHLGKVEKAMGGLLVATGLLFMTGSMSDIAYWLLETFPALGRIG